MPDLCQLQKYPEHRPCLMEELCFSIEQRRKYNVPEDNSDLDYNMGPEVEVLTLIRKERNSDEQEVNRIRYYQQHLFIEC